VFQGKEAEGMLALEVKVSAVEMLIKLQNAVILCRLAGSRG
jgi:hypothetical protein